MNEDRIARLYGNCVRFHGHDCPLLALGVRVCETALERLKLEDPAPGRLVCVSEFDGCCVDAIQIGLHCTADLPFRSACTARPAPSICFTTRQGN